MKEEGQNAGLAGEPLSLSLTRSLTDASVGNLKLFCFLVVFVEDSCTIQPGNSIALQLPVVVGRHLNHFIKLQLRDTQMLQKTFKGMTF